MEGQEKHADKGPCQISVVFRATHTSATAAVVRSVIMQPSH